MSGFLKLVFFFLMLLTENLSRVQVFFFQFYTLYALTLLSPSLSERKSFTLKSHIHVHDFAVGDVHSFDN